MQYRRLGRAGLQVSELSLGSWVTYANQVDTNAAVEMMAAAHDSGVNFFDNAEASLVDGRVVRIGNAAQTLHPVAGQGLNLGLRDAFLLVDRLVEGTAASDAGVTRALRGLAFARAPDRWSVIGATDFLARSFTWHAPGLAAARGLGLAALQALPPFKRAFARQMMFGWR